MTPYLNLYTYAKFSMLFFYNKYTCQHLLNNAFMLVMSYLLWQWRLRMFEEQGWGKKGNQRYEVGHFDTETLRCSVLGASHCLIIHMDEPSTLKKGI